jgi:hypothetical protein
MNADGRVAATALFSPHAMRQDNREKQWTRPDVAVPDVTVIASAAKQSPASCAPLVGIAASLRSSQ